MVNQEIKVGITGQAGFMGRHLYNFLGTKAGEVTLIPFKRSFFESPDDLREFVTSCEVILHTAAMNRHEDPQIIYDTNVGLIRKLIEACTLENAIPKIVFASSTQEENNTLYGRSKRDGRALLEKWALDSGASVCSFIIPNVFGPFGKPYYNSFIATFCHQLIHNEVPVIKEDKLVDLIYINELAEIFYDAIHTLPSQPVTVRIITPTASKKVSKILHLLTRFHQEYTDNGTIPNINTPFRLQLFNTFRSFLSRDHFPKTYKKYTDERGAFVEIIRADSPGQTSFSTTRPGITRGNHFHTRKVERFAVVSGRATIKLRKIDEEEIIEYILDAETPSYVDIPVWYTHNITNIGDKELITLFWINEPYRPEDPDTYSAIV